MNEAKAFAYLQVIGCAGVHFIERTNHQTPDLGGVLNESKVLCEVKTINISQDEADRSRRIGQGEVILRKIGTRVDEGFLRKLSSTVASAVKRLAAEDPQGTAHRMVFIVVHFDDWAGDHQEEYFRQVDQYLLQNPVAGAELIFCPATNLFERHITMRSAAVYLE